MAEKKITEASVLALMKEEEITASRGAGLLGIPLQDFLDLMYANGLTEWDDTPEEVEADMRVLRALRKKHHLPKKRLSEI